MMSKYKALKQRQGAKQKRQNDPAYTGIAWQGKHSKAGTWRRIKCGMEDKIQMNSQYKEFLNLND